MDRIRLVAVALALALSALAPLYLLAAAFLVKTHLVSIEFGFHSLIAKGGSIVLIAAVLAGAIAALLAFTVQPRGGRATAIICLATSLTLFGMLSFAVASGKSAPAIHDISTDAIEPPVFSQKIAALRDSKSNSLEISKSALNTQIKSYPGVKTMPFAAAPDTAFDAALSALQKEKLSIVDADKNAGKIEAATETPWLGIKQDVIVRIRPTDTGCLIDVRSASRTGNADFGANAKTVTTLLQAIKSQLSGA